MLISALTNLAIKLIKWTGIPNLASQTASQTWSLVYYLLLALLTLLVVLTTSFFLYATFYYAYMPAKLFEEELSLQFSTCSSSPGPCTHPNATVKIDPQRFRLVPGQSYSVGVVMELPGSPTNKVGKVDTTFALVVIMQELGMFMSCLNVVSSGHVVKKQCRSSVLEFRSNALSFLDDLFFFPFMMFGSHAQSQTIRVLYYR